MRATIPSFSHALRTREAPSGPRRRASWAAPASFAGLLLRFPEPGETLLKLGQAAATIDELLGAAGPRRMRLGIDVEVHRVARITPGRAGEELGAVGHDDL